MLKRKLYNIFVLTSLIMFVTTMTLINQDRQLAQRVNFPHDITYLDQSKVYYNHYEVYLENENTLLTRVVVELEPSNEENRIVSSLFDVLKDSDYASVLPKGFKQIIPKDTFIIDSKVEQGVLRLNLSNEFLKLSKENEKAAIQSLIYTMTSLDFVDQLDLLIDGKELRSMPKSKLYLPPVLNRNFGINEQIEASSIYNMDSVMVYYVFDDSQNSYYVPVFKYVDPLKDKVDYIIQELSTDLSMKYNLKSYMNFNTKLLSHNLKDGELSLQFNESLLGTTNKTLLKETLYSLVLSLCELEEVQTVTILVGDQILYEKLTRPIE